MIDVFYRIRVVKYNSLLLLQTFNHLGLGQKHKMGRNFISGKWDKRLEATFIGLMLNIRTMKIL